MSLSSIRRFLTDNFLMLSFGFNAVFWGNFGQSFFLSWYGGPIRETMGMSASLYGGIYSLATLASGTAIIFIGGFMDRVPLRAYSFWVAMGLILGCVLMSVSFHPAILVCAVFMVRLCGQGLFPHMGMTLMAREYTSHRGKAISIASSAVPLGEIVLPLAAVLAIGLVGWRGSWLIVAASTLLMYLPLSRWQLSSIKKLNDRKGSSLGQHIADSDIVKISFLQVLSDSKFLLVIPGLMLAPFVVTGLFVQQAWILQDKAWGSVLFAQAFFAYGVSHWLGSLSAGFLVDAYSAKRMLSFYLVPLILGLLTLAWADASWMAHLVLALIGFSIGLAGTVGSALWAELYGNDHLGKVRACVTSIMVWATALSPFVFGYLMDVSFPFEHLCLAAAAYGGLTSLLGLALWSFEGKIDLQRAPANKA